MRITNKHLEPRGCDTIGETITDEKVHRILSGGIDHFFRLNRFVVYMFW